MPTFRYSYAAEGSPEGPRTGLVEAADRAEALWQLASQGMDPTHVMLVEVSPEDESAAEQIVLHEEDTQPPVQPEPGTPDESRPIEDGQDDAQGETPQAEDTKSVSEKSATDADRGYRLGDAEGELLAGELSGLVASGLPLPEGLRALAEELGHRRAAAVLRQLAERIEGGASLEEALETVGDQLPRHVRGLIEAGATSGTLGQVLEGYVDLQRDQAELRRRMWLAVAYPLLLLGLLAGLFVFFGAVLAPGFHEVFMDFEAKLPFMTELFFWFFPVGVWYTLGLLVALVGLFLFALFGPAPRWMRLCVFEIPLFGPFCRWSRLMPFARLMALFIEQGTPLPEALRLTAAGLPDRHLAAGCLRAAEEVSSGRSLGEGLAAAGTFPPSALPLFDWGDRFGSLSVAFRFVADSFQGRTRFQVELMHVIALPAVMLVVLLAGLNILALFLPLIRLIETLS